MNVFSCYLMIILWVTLWFYQEQMNKPVRAIFGLITSIFIALGIAVVFEIGADLL